MTVNQTSKPFFEEKKKVDINQEIEEKKAKVAELEEEYKKIK
jgi:hypothetical protein